MTQSNAAFPRASVLALAFMVLIQLIDFAFSVRAGDRFGLLKYGLGAATFGLILLAGLLKLRGRWHWFVGAVVAAYTMVVVASWT